MVSAEAGSMSRPLTGAQQSWSGPSVSIETKSCSKASDLRAPVMIVTPRVCRVVTREKQPANKLPAECRAIRHRLLLPVPAPGSHEDHQTPKQHPLRPLHMPPNFMTGVPNAEILSAIGHDVETERPTRTIRGDPALSSFRNAKSKSQRHPHFVVRWPGGGVVGRGNASRHGKCQNHRTRHQFLVDDDLFRQLDVKQVLVAMQVALARPQALRLHEAGSWEGSRNRQNRQTQSGLQDDAWQYHPRFIFQRPGAARTPITHPTDEQVYGMSTSTSHPAGMGTWSKRLGWDCWSAGVDSVRWFGRPPKEQNFAEMSTHCREPCHVSMSTPSVLTRDDNKESGS